MSRIRRPNDYWVYKAEEGFIRLGGCSKETAEKMHRETYPDHDFLLQAKDLDVLFDQTYKAVKYQRDFEEEHYESMRHDAEGD